jgi:cellulose synthase/poly-beta-1,6-N-acetylglucosamine synthase-like glycosyltransferase
MIVPFIFSGLIIFYIFIGYPLVLSVLSLLFGKKVKRRDICPAVSLIISAYNEEKVIREKIENTFELDYPKDKLEIIVASESTDKTNEIAAEYLEKNVVLCAYQKREGKRATLYRTVPKAKGEIIVFSDANALYKRDAIKKLVRNFADKRIGCVSGRLIYVNPKESSIGEGETTYWEYEFFIKKMASRLFLLSGGVNGSIFAIRKALYNPIDKYRGDDFEIASRIQIAGYGVILEPEAISYEETSANARQEFSRKVRLVTWNIKSVLLLLAEAMKKRRFFTAFLLFSHRLLRYTTPVWLLVIFISNSFLLGGPLKYFFFLQMVFFFLAFSGFIIEKMKRQINPLFLMPFYFSMVNFAAFIGLMKNIFEKPEMVWEKAR